MPEPAVRLQGSSTSIRAMRRGPWLVVALVVGLLPAGLGVPAGATAAPRHATSGIVAAPPSCAAAAACTYKVKHASASYPASGDFPRLHVLNGPNNDQPAEIDYDIYIPDVALATPQPAIMYFNGFGGAKDDSSGTKLGRFFASHGYVYLPFTSEGFGHSAGTIELDSPEFDVKNARRLIDLLATRSYVLKDGPGDPRLGLTGGSYGGAIQLEVAEFDQRVDAVTPFRTWNSLEYSLGPNNLASGYHFQALPCCGVFKTEWTTLFFASGLTQPFTGNGGGQAAIPGQLPCPGYDPRLCQAYLTSLSTNTVSPTTRALVDNSSPASYFNGGRSYDQVSGGLNVPTLIGQGEEDTLFNLNDSIASYQGIQARGVPVKMLWHSNGHGYPDQPGEDDAFAGDVSNPNVNYIPQRLMSWFNRYVRLDPAVDTGPGFAYFRDWVAYDTRGTAAPAYGTAPAYPAQALLTFNLSGSSDLLPPGRPVVAGTALVVNPPLGQPASYTETSNFQCPSCSLPGGAPTPFSSIQPSNPACAPGTCEFADFTTPPLSRTIISVGVPTAHLHIAGTGVQQVVFFGKVFDVAPDGTALLVKRLISPVRVFEAGKPVDFQLPGLVHRFEAGHRVRLEIASTDLTSGNNRLADLLTLTQPAGADPSTFSLPVDSVSAAATAFPPAVVAGGGGGLPDTRALPGLRPGGLLVLVGLLALLLTAAGRVSRLRNKF
jgi:hypothetical protein